MIPYSERIKTLKANALEYISVQMKDKDSFKLSLFDYLDNSDEFQYCKITEIRKVKRHFGDELVIVHTGTLNDSEDETPIDNLNIELLGAIADSLYLNPLKTKYES